MSPTAATTMPNNEQDRLTRTAAMTALGVLMAVAMALRLYQLNTALWYDEIVTLLVSVRPPLLQIVSQFEVNNDHPLYSVLAHLSVVSLGEAPWTLRLPSVLFGVAALPALYLLARTVASRLEALLAVTILTVSYHHIWFSQNARGYTLLMLCVLGATYLLLRWFESHRYAYAAGYAVVTALGAYTHLTMVFVSVSHFLVCAVVLFGRRASPRIRRDWTQAMLAFGGAGALTLLLYAPKLAGVQRFFTAETVTENEVATPIWALWQAIQGLQLGFGTLWGVVFGALILGAGIWSYFKQSPVSLSLLVLPVPVTLASGVLAGRPIFPRFVFFAIGFALLITVRGAVVLGERLGQASGAMQPRRAGMIAASLLTIAAMLLSIRSLPYGYRYPKQDYIAAADYVERQKQPDNLVAVVGVTGAVPLRDYLRKSWPRIDREQDLRQLVSNGRPVWVLFTLPAYIIALQPTLWTMLQEECREMSRFEGTVAGGAISVVRCNMPGS